MEGFLDDTGVMLMDIEIIDKTLWLTAASRKLSTPDNQFLSNGNLYGDLLVFDKRLGNVSIQGCARVESFRLDAP